MATKAIHIDVEKDLSTETFMAILTRFVARRDEVFLKTLIQTTAKILKGANNNLKKLYLMFN